MTNKEKLFTLPTDVFSELVFWNGSVLHNFFKNYTQSQGAFTDWLEAEYNSESYLWEKLSGGIKCFI